MYLPLAGPISLTVLAGFVLTEYLSGRFSLIGRFLRQAGVILTVTVLIVFITLTLQRNNDYRNSESIWRATLEVVPANPTACSYLGDALAEQGRHDEAVDCYLRGISLEMALLGSSECNTIRETRVL